MGMRESYDYGADVCAQGFDGDTALHVAATGINDIMVDLLN
jgi:ankyrin repeat protein